MQSEPLSLTMRLRALKHKCQTRQQQTMFNTLCRSVQNRNVEVDPRVSRQVLRGGRAQNIKQKKMYRPKRLRHHRAKYSPKKKAVSRTRVFKKYLPKKLSPKLKVQQLKEMQKSRRLYQQYRKLKKLGKLYKNRNKRVYVRKKVPQHQSKPSKHVTRAKRLYGLKSIRPNKEMARKTGCSVKGLTRIMCKGRSAYQSGGSRLNQNMYSWGYARLASATTGGKASRVDYHILNEECKKGSRGLKMASPGSRHMDS